ncbi:hypothetical protein NBRC116601_10780 [Cognatishimia sp. WU-CL00825]|uniref:excinuclease ABC subunit A n=1 Tax=Cognatishimia sp. WU-CL00825 TaxID=3127658 RepID=UPI0031026DCD
MSLNNSIKMLNAVSIGTALFGIAMVLALFTPLAQVLDVFLDLAHFPLDAQQSANTETERLLVAICGGLLVGLAVLVWMVTNLVYAENPALGARIIATGLLAWFFPDSIGSAVAGAWFNIFMNSLFLLLFLWPLRGSLQSARNANT